MLVEKPLLNMEIIGKEWNDFDEIVLDMKDLIYIFTQKFNKFISAVILLQPKGIAKIS